MKTWISSMKHIDDYIAGRLSPEEHILFEARELLDPVLKFQVILHKKVISIARLYGRKKMKAEITVIGKKLFTDPSKGAFQQTVRQVFDKN